MSAGSSRSSGCGAGCRRRSSPRSSACPNGELRGLPAARRATRRRPERARGSDAPAGRDREIVLFQDRGIG
jgi:hypothetical protein